MSRDQIATVCQQFPIDSIKKVFKFLSEQEIAALCPYMELKKVAADTVVIKEGDPGDFMGFLVHGRLSVRKETAFPGKEVLMAILEAGSLVGESAIVKPSVRNATVVAVVDCELLILSHENMRKLNASNPALAVKVLERIIAVVSLRFSKVVERLSKLLEPF